MSVLAKFFLYAIASVAPLIPIWDKLTGGITNTEPLYVMAESCRLVSVYIQPRSPESTDTAVEERQAPSTGHFDANRVERPSNVGSAETVARPIWIPDTATGAFPPGVYGEFLETLLNAESGDEDPGAVTYRLQLLDMSL